jgi:hypothetical protein
VPGICPPRPGSTLFRALCVHAGDAKRQVIRWSAERGKDNVNVNAIRLPQNINFNSSSVNLFMSSACFFKRKNDATNLPEF